MFAKSSLVVFALALLCGQAVQATVEAPVTDAINKAVAEAMQKMLGIVGGKVEATANIAQPLVTNTQQAFADARSMVQNLGSGILGTAMNLGSSLGNAANQLDAVMQAYEAQYCTPASFTPAQKKPAKFSGHSFELSLNSGSCEFDEEELIYNNQKVLNCVEPSIVLTKSPANFTSKYKSAPEFVSKECKIEKTFGEEIQKVLYVFDGSVKTDIASITGTVMNEIKSLTGMIGTAHSNLASQVTKFVGSIPKIGDAFGTS